MPSSPDTRATALTGRRALMLAWRVGFFAWLALTIWPVSYGITRLAQFLLIGALWLSALVLFWLRPWIRWSLLAALLMALGLFCLPGHKPNAAALRMQYVTELKRYTGARYVWGGENALGIDCSGLVRRALFQALLKEGLGTLNPFLNRQAASLWWHDASAHALAAEYRGQTKRIRTSTSINDIEGSQLLPGDLAITADGVHVLAYLGGDTWIEADPGERRVLSLRTTAEKHDPNSWLELPVTLVRWRILMGGISCPSG